ncbi:structural protein [Cellulophaga phage phi48:2]|uniref:structural protein n=1 Tax=Cellulophaga phage phi48:2 TaxID=1327968 RepID=UPI00035197BA|nr:structural protein [Cellulophaga phage phi48:2]AGO47271.1 structural protein [Cellulophaga phage phi48:2]
MQTYKTFNSSAGLTPVYRNQQCYSQFIGTNNYLTRGFNPYLLIKFYEIGDFVTCNGFTSGETMERVLGGQYQALIRIDIPYDITGLGAFYVNSTFDLRYPDMTFEGLFNSNLNTLDIYIYCRDCKYPVSAGNTLDINFNVNFLKN